MALRSTDDESSKSPVPSYDWEQRQQLFEVAVLARHSISVTEITESVDKQNPRVPALMGNLEKMRLRERL